MNKRCEQDKICNRLKIYYKANPIELVYYGLCLFSVVVLVFKAFVGIGMTDESYYVAETLTMLHGNTPYALDNYTYATGFPFFLMPQLYVFETITGDTEGIFLFSRISYLIFLLSCISVSAHVLGKKLKRESVVAYVTFMISVSFGVGINNYSYNSVPALLMLVTGALLFDAIENKARHENPRLITGGVLTTISVLAHPAYAVACLCFLTLILFRGGKSRIKRLLIYSGGGVVSFIVILSIIICNSGFNLLYLGLINIIKPVSFSPSVTLMATEKSSIIFKLLTNCFIAGMLGTILFSIIYLLRTGRRTHIVKKELLQKCFAFFVLISIAFETYKTIEYNDYINYRLGLVAIFALIFFSIGGIFKNPIILYWGLYQPIIAILLICMVNSVLSPAYRFNILAPVLAMCIINVIELGRKWSSFFGLAAIVTCLIAISFVNTKSLFTTPKLCRIGSGVYKGIYTSEQLARDIPDLERFIEQNVGENDMISYRDMAPFCYLMTKKGIACDMTTWDSLNYYPAHKNTPLRLYQYYKRIGAIPDIIIYCHYKEFSDKLSIEDETILYNEFVVANYELLKTEKLNDSFDEIKVYKKKDISNVDIDYWIEKHMKDLYNKGY